MTMQLARSFWLDQDKNFKAKIAEIFPDDGTRAAVHKGTDPRVLCK